MLPVMLLVMRPIKRPWLLPLRQRGRSASLVAGAGLLVAVGLTLAAAPTTFDGISWSTIDGGGGAGSSATYAIACTAGQPDAGGIMSGGAFTLAGGFWQGGAISTGVGGGEGDPTAGTPPLPFQLHPVHPNPFNPSTTLAFDLPQAAHVVLRIFDVRGQRVCTLLDERRPAGRTSLQWRGADASGAQVASGVYVVTIEAGDHHARQKIALVR
jgi:hypothetical protein